MASSLEVEQPTPVPHVDGNVHSLSSYTATAPLSQTSASLSANAIPLRVKGYRLPAVLMRAGTSRGLFLHGHDLPPGKADWAPFLIAAMGSRYGDKRQLEGVGGATSTTSKVIVVNKSHRLGVDVEYTFVQVAVGEEDVDMSGNCGNMASGVGAFAVDEGLVPSDRFKDTEVSVRIYNTNTGSELVETVQVDPVTGLFDPEGSVKISGVRASGSPVKVEFISPGGAVTGKTLPTGHKQETLMVEPVPEDSKMSAPFSVQASIVDVANPFVFVDAESLPENYFESDGPDSQTARNIVEAIRRRASVVSGITPNLEAASKRKGTPKIALVAPVDSRLARFARGNTAVANVDGPKPDIFTQSYSMQRTHPSLALTGCVCLSSAMSLGGTVPAKVAASLVKEHTEGLPTPPGSENGQETWLSSVVIQHPAGTMNSDARLGYNNGDVEVKGVTVLRTAKRLFEGKLIL